MPRTHGTAQYEGKASIWSVVPPRLSDDFAVRSRAACARATCPADERFYTTVLLIRERATEGWRVSTLTMKES